MRTLSTRSNSAATCSAASTPVPAQKWLASRIGEALGRWAPATTSGAMSTRPLEMLTYGTPRRCA
jgi:hypothetical protein